MARVATATTTRKRYPCSRMARLESAGNPDQEEAGMTHDEDLAYEEWLDRKVEQIAADPKRLAAQLNEICTANLYTSGVFGVTAVVPDQIISAMSALCRVSFGIGGDVLTEKMHAAGYMHGTVLGVLKADLRGAESRAEFMAERQKEVSRA